MTKLDSIASEIIKQKQLDMETANSLWSADFHELLYHANKIREHFKGNKINFCSVINAKSGKCSENCRFCAQSVHYKTDAEEYPFIDEAAIEKAMRKAKESGASCFGVVTSGRRLSKDDIKKLAGILPHLKDSGIRISGSLGGIDSDSLRLLKENGLKRFHHNLETAESFFDKICTTHSFKDRVATVQKAKDIGLEVCSGGIFGLGETRMQRVEFAWTLRDMGVDSIPLNFLNPIPGTPLEHQQRLSCNEILRTVAVFRFVLPDKDISVCGGREVNLRDMQSWMFYAGANGMMVGGYLTTQGRPVEQDLQMIEDLGLGINRETAESNPPSSPFMKGGKRGIEK